MASIYDKASLVLIPSGTKTSKVYSQKPVNGDGDFTFSRSTAATRVNADGNIEKETQNLFTYSNDFSNAAWSKVNGPSVTSGQSGYDGSSDAWTLTKTSNNFSHLLQSVTISGVFTFSVYAKGTSDRFCLRETAGMRLEVDLSDGSITLQQSGVIAANVEDVGNGWYRVSATFNQSVTGLQIYPKFNSSDIESVTIQDAQLEQGLVARDYIETTTSAVEGGITDNVPRLDYTDSSCPALLLEPQRTNRILHSEYSGDYSTQGIVSMTDNFANSPEGYDNAFRVIPTTSNVQHLFFRSGMGGAALTYTQSIYAKANGYNFCFIRFDLPTRYAFFDLQNGTTAYTDSEITSTITDMGNGWYRCTATMTTTNYANAVIGVAEAGASQADKDFAGDGASSVLFYGHQSEEGSYATSYIPTYGSAVTRNVGTAINQSNSNLPTSYPFSLFAEVDVVDTSSGYAITFLTASNSANYYTIEYYSNLWHITARPNGGTTRISSTTAPTLGVHKLLGVYTDSTMKLYLDGALIASGSHSQAFNSNIDDLLIGQLRTAADVGTRNPVRQALMFNQELSNQEAIDLTTL